MSEASKKQNFKKKSWKLVYEKMNFQFWKKSAHLWMSAVCLLFCQLFVYICQLFVYFYSWFLVVCLLFDSSLFSFSNVCLLLSADFQRLFLNLKNDWEYLLNSAFLVFQVGSHPYWPIFSKRHFAFHYSSLKQGRRSSSRWWYYPRDLPK